jgi:hypothetical protein
MLMRILDEREQIGRSMGVNQTMIIAAQTIMIAAQTIIIAAQTIIIAAQTIIIAAQTITIAAASRYLLGVYLISQLSSISLQ